jgi:hypothetical protein
LLRCQVCGQILDGINNAYVEKKEKIVEVRKRDGWKENTSVHYLCQYRDLMYRHLELDNIVESWLNFTSMLNSTLWQIWPFQRVLVAVG